jgi:hypothetical protein
MRFWHAGGYGVLSNALSNFDAPAVEMAAFQCELLFRIELSWISPPG